MDGQEFCLKWDSFQSSVTSVFDCLRQDEELVDITLCCEGQSVNAHRMMLSACSPYFRELLKGNPCQKMVFFLKDTSPADLKAIIEFMYKGSVNVAQSQLASFIKTAEMLQIRGLSGDDEKAPVSPPSRRAAPAPPAASVRPRRPATPPAKRRRVSGSRPTAEAGAPEPEVVEVGPGAQGADPVAVGGQEVAAAEPPAASDVSAAPAVTSLVGSPQRQLAEVEEQAGAVVPAGGAPSASAGSELHLPANEAVKVEKLELAPDEDVSLDATLDYVGDYESSYGEPEVSGQQLPPGELSFGGMPGPSQRLGDESVQGHVCEICGRSYRHIESLIGHRKMHMGLTTCPLCGKVYSLVKDLRRHIIVSHGLSEEETRELLPATVRRRPRRSGAQMADMSFRTDYGSVSSAEAGSLAGLLVSAPFSVPK